MTFAALLSVDVAEAIEVKGQVSMPYKSWLFGTNPTDRDKAEAIRQVKLAAIKNFTSGFSTASMLQQRVQGMQLQGVSERFSSTSLKHPLTGQRLAVLLYEVSPDNAKMARQVEKTNYRAAESLERSNQYSAGVKSGLDQSYQNTKQDPTQFEAGQQEGLSSTQNQSGTFAPKSQGSVPGGEGAYQGAGSSTDVFQF